MRKIESERRKRGSEMRRANEKGIRMVVETLKVEAGKSENGGSKYEQVYSGKV